MSNKVTLGIKEMWEYKVSLAKYIKFLSDKGMNENNINDHLTEVKIDTMTDYFHIEERIK